MNSCNFKVHILFLYGSFYALYFHILFSFHTTIGCTSARVLNFKHFFLLNNCLFISWFLFFYFRMSVLLFESFFLLCSRFGLILGAVCLCTKWRKSCYTQFVIIILLCEKPHGSTCSISLSFQKTRPVFFMFSNIKLSCFM